MEGNYGWRARIGLFLPAGNTIMEADLFRMCPEGVSFLATRMPIKSVTKENLTKMADHAENAAQCFCNIGCSGLVYGCTSGSFVIGLEWERTLMNSLEKIVSCPAISTSGALLQALEYLGVTNISLFTPYTPEINELESAFFTNAGYHIVNADGLNKTWDISEVPPSVIYKKARSLITPQTEVLLISCTDFRAIDCIESLEQDIGIPVLTSNQASLWAALRLCGVNAPVARRWGRIFDS